VHELDGLEGVEHDVLDLNQF
jgi:hypothetical protein